MIIAPHFLTGAAIASGVKNPLLAVPLALLSHFVLDLIPHKDMVGDDHLSPENLSIRLVDIFATAFLFLVFVPVSLRVYALIIGLVAISPDLIALPGAFIPDEQKKGFFLAFKRFHVDLLQGWFRPYIDWFWGLVSQLVILLLALTYLAR